MSLSSKLVHGPRERNMWLKIEVTSFHEKVSALSLELCVCVCVCVCVEVNGFYLEMKPFVD